MKNIWSLFLLIILYSCGTEPEGTVEGGTENSPADSATWIVNQAIATHGGKNIENSRISLDFRDRHYISDRKGGQFTYERIWQDTSGDNYRDVLTNEELYREINGERVTLSAKDSSAYANSTNSVIYFALLPYFLNDPAVRKSYLGKGQIKGQSYYEIKVTFRQEGGGKDYEDEFLYWIHTEDFTMDYLAYNYITDGGGARFREAYNVRTIEGIRFADYINYKPTPDTKEVAIFDDLYNRGELEELSRIESKNIEVKLH